MKDEFILLGDRRVSACHTRSPIGLKYTLPVLILIRSGLQHRTKTRGEMSKGTEPRWDREDVRCGGDRDAFIIGEPEPIVSHAYCQGLSVSVMPNREAG